uniref:Alpha-glucanase n=1 Tax=Colletotrichum fructicola (strain Nara gc5) TaxID=1213859 RepID=L2FAV8_COLFN
MRLNLLLAAFAGTCHVQAASVFAHFMVGNTAEYTDELWRSDIQLAKEAHIDAFVLNMAHGDAVNEPSLERAFSSAKAEGFKLLFSFGYAGRGPWPKDIVIGYLKKFGSTAEYFKHGDGKPLVSTFEGPGNAKDWIDIKKEVSCFFIPDWSSRGAETALALGDGVADGLFNWAAWPWGPRDIDTYNDASYIGPLVNKPYMMPVSPWFYTNMPGYNKNWLWRGDDMWHNRWIQVIYNLPEQIISWNDYAESHYIAPVYNHALKAFDVGKAPFNYANNRPHDGWRLTLPFWIDFYKTGRATITQEGIVTWYRTSPASACSDGGTVGNTASQLQMEFAPEAVMQDKIFFSAILGATAQVTVTLGGQTFSPGWSSIPDGDVGVYHGSFSFNSSGGNVTVQLARGSQVIARIDGTAIGASSCNNGHTNWNPWVGSALVPGPVSITTPRPRGEQGCIEGTGAEGFTELCEFNCKYDYCPVSSCVCTAVGVPNKKPTALEVDSLPARGRSKYYMELCSSACNLGYCPEQYCSPTLEPMVVSNLSEFLPPACRAGTGRVGHESLAGLCSYACKFGFCPIHACHCTEEGTLIEPPPQVKGVSGKPVGNLNDEKLCAFACSRAWCPADACESAHATEDNDNDDDEEPETNPS